MVMYSTGEISPDVMQKLVGNKRKAHERTHTEISGSAWEHNWVVGSQILTVSDQMDIYSRGTI